MTTIHRGGHGRFYRDLPIHAAEGVHEYAHTLLTREVPHGSSILDVGAGSGALSQRLSDAGYVVTAADFDLRDYRATPPAVEWDVVNPDIPPEITEGAYEAICAIELLEHVENPLQALRNLRTLMRPGAVLLLSTPHLGHPKSRIKFLLRGAPSYFGSAEYHDTGHRTLLPDWLLLRHLQSTGYVDATVSYAGAFGLSGWRSVAYRILRAWLGAARALPSPRSGDGAVAFVIARPGPFAE
jgi:SAM-dependent methyltransferase